MWDNQEEEFSNEYTDTEEKHQAIADIIMADIIAGFEESSVEVLMILSERLKKMAQGEFDGDAEIVVGLVNTALNAPYICRNEPLNRFIIDAIYSAALSIAELDL